MVCVLRLAWALPPPALSVCGIPHYVYRSHIIHIDFKVCPTLKRKTVVFFSCSQGKPHYHCSRLREQTRNTTEVPCFQIKVFFILPPLFLSLSNGKRPGLLDGPFAMPGAGRPSGLSRELAACPARTNSGRSALRSARFSWQYGFTWRPSGSGWTRPAWGRP